MNRADLLQLQAMQEYPSVTITLPTHRTSPDNRQDPIRVGNLVTEATNRLLTEFTERDLQALQANLQQVVAEIDYTHTLDGLAIFASNSYATKFYLPFPLEERVIIDEDFYTRDMVYALNRSPRYFVLVLSEQSTRLLEGLRGDLTEIRTGGFPLTHTGPGGASTLPNDPAVNSSAYRDENHRMFFRKVDQALGDVLANDPLPVGLVGVDRYHSFFREVTHHGRYLVEQGIVGNHDRTSLHELAALIQPLVEEAMHARQTAVIEELNAAQGAQRVAATLNDIWRFAHEGRGAKLVVEESFHYPARVNADGTGLDPIDVPRDPDDLDDAVDEIIETMLEKGGEVVFVDDGHLSQYERIALMLRY